MSFEYARCCRRVSVASFADRSWNAIPLRIRDRSWNGIPATVRNEATELFYNNVRIQMTLLNTDALCLPFSNRTQQRSFANNWQSCRLTLCLHHVTAIFAKAQRSRQKPIRFGRKFQRIEGETKAKPLAK